MTLPEKINQHSVPQFFFRLFNDGSRKINLVTKQDSRLIFGASIRHQCSRRKYYGSTEVEKKLEQIEAQHSEVYRKIVSESESSSLIKLTAEERYLLGEAMSLQHARVPRVIEDRDRAARNTQAHITEQFLQSLPCSPFGEQTQGKQLRVEFETQYDTLAKTLADMQNSLRMARNLLDLNCVVLRNETSFPFVFGDAPCLYCNPYIYHIKHFPTLRYNSPGLMILMPLNSRTYALLYDSEVYDVEGNAAYFVALENLGDVFRLNDLQIHAAKTCIYFCEECFSSDIANSVDKLRPTFETHFSRSMTYPPGTVIANCEINRSPILSTFESQLPLILDLSFLQVAEAKFDERKIPSPLLDIRRSGFKPPKPSKGELIVGPSYTIKFKNIEVQE